MKTTYRRTLSALFAGVLVFGLGACSSAGNMSGSDIRGPLDRPAGPVGSSGGGSTGSGGPDNANNLSKNTDGATSRPNADGTNSSMPPPTNRNSGSTGQYR